MQRKVAVVVVVLALIGAGAYFMVKMNSTTPQATSPAANTQSVAATITYDGKEFTPATVTVKTGDTVAVKNDSDTDVEFDSDPHPVHTNNSELNVDLISGGQVKTFTVTKKGTFGYHNHLNPAQKGTIVVE